MVFVVGDIMEKKEKIALISIGKEILSGDTLNTNSMYLSKILSYEGYQVVRQIACEDRKEDIFSAIEEAYMHADVVITTGGLGPTVDDKTKEVLALFFKKKLALNQEILQKLKKRFKDHPSLENQALLPEGVQLIENTIGTACGMIFEEKKVLIALPGIPQEMMMMVEKGVLSFLQRSLPVKQKLFIKEIALALIAEMQVDFFLRKLPDTIEAGIYPTYGFVRVSLVSKNEKILLKHYEEIKQEFADFLLPENSKTIEEAVRAAFIQNKKTLVVAESCTGGAIAQRITSLSDASAFFLGGFVTYSNKMKEKFLHVSKETLQEHGAVSLQTVKEMAQNALKETDADVAIAVTGIAGPKGGSSEKPVGTVYVAVAQKGMAIDAGCIHAKGDRLGVIFYTTNYALAILCRHIIHKKNYFE